MTEQKPQRKTILIVDDEPNIVKYLDALLQDNGYDTATAENGNEALEVLKTVQPDLICLDITMPEKSGIRFYREIKEMGEPAASIPIIVVTAVTGYGGNPDPFRQFLSTRRQVPPPEEFISKPIEQAAFLETVAKVLAA